MSNNIYWCNTLLKKSQFLHVIRARFKCRKTPYSKKNIINYTYPVTKYVASDIINYFCI